MLAAFFLLFEETFLTKNTIYTYLSSVVLRKKMSYGPVRVENQSFYFWLKIKVEIRFLQRDGTADSIFYVAKGRNTLWYFKIFLFYQDVFFSYVIFLQILNFAE